MPSPALSSKALSRARYDSASDGSEQLLGPLPPGVSLLHRAKTRHAQGRNS